MNVLAIDLSEVKYLYSLNNFISNSPEDPLNFLCLFIKRSVNILYKFSAIILQVCPEFVILHKQIIKQTEEKEAASDRRDKTPIPEEKVSSQRDVWDPPQ